jgi:polyisoprenoid-binding protein YceI
MTAQVDIPGYVTGSWVIDATRSTVSFSVKQAGFSTVRGSFGAVSGSITTTPDPWRSSVRAVVEVASIDTKIGRRDEHLRTKDFLDAEAYPTITFASTGVRADGDALLVDGELTVHGVTRPVTLTTDLEGFGVGPDGSAVVRFAGRTRIDRTEFGVTCGPAGPFVSKKVTITLAVEATRQV